MGGGDLDDKIVLDLIGWSEVGEVGISDALEGFVRFIGQDDGELSLRSVPERVCGDGELARRAGSGLRPGRVF